MQIELIGLIVNPNPTQPLKRKIQVEFGWWTARLLLGQIKSGYIYKRESISTTNVEI